jgi:DNA processing protein
VNDDTTTTKPLEFGFQSRAVSTFREIGAYEALWDTYDGIPSFRTIAQKFREHPDTVPSDFVKPEVAVRYAEQVIEIVRAQKLERFGVRIHGTEDYPEQLRDAQHPVELLYFRGYWDLLAAKAVAVVGTRAPSAEGMARTRKLVRALVEADFTIISGLATGVDTIAHLTAIEAGGRTIGILGTPLSQSYPAINLPLQEHLAKEFLVVSQVPFCRYRRQSPKLNRLFFPERNITMSALTRATVIVEAGETSGTLVQARAALKQKRQLFILDSCFRNPHLTWPAKFEKKGAIRVANFDDISRHLGETPKD